MSVLVRCMSADGVELVAERRNGSRSGAVLLLHGGGQTRHTWSSVSAELTNDGWTTLAADLRGHGGSGRGSYAPEAFVADVAMWAELVVEAGPLVVVGASLGGLISLVAVGEALVPASGLVLVDVTPRLEPAGVERVLDFMRADPNGFADLEQAADAVALYRGRTRSDRDVSGLTRYLRLGDDQRWRWHWDPDLLNVASSTVGDRHHQLLAAARKLTVPVLVVRGADSDVVGDDGVDELLLACPTARVASVETAGHLVASDDADAFAGIIRSFVTEQLSKSV